MTVPQNPQSVLNMVETKVVPEKATVAKWCSETWRPILSEFLSTTLLILVGCMCTLPIDGIVDALIAPLGFGFIVMFNIHIFGHISGAHMNPSVTLAAAIWGIISAPTAIAFFIVQCLGAIFGYGILMTVSPILLTESGVCMTLVNPKLNAVQALVIEIALTTALNFMNCACWDPVNKNKTEAIPLKFGLAIAGLSLAGGHLTGASMNPARTLGPALWNWKWDMHWVYWVGPLVGAVFPTFLYKFAFLRPEPKVE